MLKSASRRTLERKGTQEKVINEKCAWKEKKAEGEVLRMEKTLPSVRNWCRGWTKGLTKEEGGKTTTWQRKHT